MNAYHVMLVVYAAIVINMAIASDYWSKDIHGTVRMRNRERSSNGWSFKDMTFSKWPEAKLYWAWDPSDEKITEEHKRTFHEALMEWESKTCIRFIESDNQTIINIDVSSFPIQGVAMSTLGWVGNASQCYGPNGQLDKECHDIFDQAQNIKFNDHVNKAVLVHEIGHSIGFLHTQSRLDRDKYVTINKDNVDLIGYSMTEQDLEANFGIYDPRMGYRPVEGIPFDHGSIMMYSKYLFGKKIEKGSSTLMITIQTNDPNYLDTIGTAQQPSFIDFLEANIAYRCQCPNGESDSKTISPKIQLPVCFNGGYPAVNSCSECECPSGFAKPFCSTIQPTNEGGYIAASDKWHQLLRKNKQIVGNWVIFSPPYYKTWMTNETAYSVYHIKAPIGKRVQLEITDINNMAYLYWSLCVNGFLEIKGVQSKFPDGSENDTDFRLTGYRFCDSTKAQYLYSKGQTAVVIIKTNFPIAFLIKYRAVNRADVSNQQPSTYYKSKKIPKPAMTFSSNIHKAEKEFILSNNFNKLEKECCGHLAELHFFKNATTKDISVVKLFCESMNPHQCESDAPEWGPDNAGWVPEAQVLKSEP